MNVFTPKYILCPVEMDLTGPLVLSCASLLAEKYGAQVRIVHSYWIDWPRYFIFRAGKGICEKDRTAHSHDEQNLAQEEAVDLIVMGAEHKPFLEFTTWGTRRKK